MSFQCGFFNSVNGDRKYNAEQISKIFDGLMTEGVVAHYGEKFNVTPGTGMNVVVGSGRCWFHHIWGLSDGNNIIKIDPSDATRYRKDVVVIQVDKRDEVRNASIKVIKGTLAASNPQVPALNNSENLADLPLAYVTINPNTTSISASSIQVLVGTSSCPYITGILESIDIDNLLDQWEGQFDDWFSNVKEQLSGNVATNLQSQIDNLGSTKVNKTDFNTTVTNLNTQITSTGFYIDGKKYIPYIRKDQAYTPVELVQGPPNMYADQYHMYGVFGNSIFVIYGGSSITSVTAMLAKENGEIIVLTDSGLTSGSYNINQAWPLSETKLFAVYTGPSNNVRKVIFDFAAKTVTSRGNINGQYLGYNASTNALYTYLLNSSGDSYSTTVTIYKTMLSSGSTSAIHTISNVYGYSVNSAKRIGNCILEYFLYSSSNPYGPHVCSIVNDAVRTISANSLKYGGVPSALAIAEYDNYSIFKLIDSSSAYTYLYNVTDNTCTYLSNVIPGTYAIFVGTLPNGNSVFAWGPDHSSTGFTNLSVISPTGSLVSTSTISATKSSSIALINGRLPAMQSGKYISTQAESIIAKLESNGSITCSSSKFCAIINSNQYPNGGFEYGLARVSLPGNSVMPTNKGLTKPNLDTENLIMYPVLVRV